ncbi:MAG TPA: hypothetical protein VHP14_16570, partial [Anaerolineales bacterium]|nr:hypothetical protein [Anaerolineales bacterium]
MKDRIPRLSRPPKRTLLLIVFMLILIFLTSGCTGATAPGVTLTVDPQSPEPQQVTSGVKLLVLMTVLSLAPAI